MPSDQASTQEGGSLPDNSDKTFDSNHKTLQARIELQREKVRALELAAEGRRRTKQVQGQLRNQEHPRRRWVEQRWIDGPIREQSVVLRYQNSGEALGAANEAIRQVRLAQIEQISELERQRDEQRRRERQVQDELERQRDERRRRTRQLQDVLERLRDERRRRERQVQDELGMQALLRHKGDKAQDAECQRQARLQEAGQKRTQEDERRRKDRGDRDGAGRQAIQRHKISLQAQKAQQKSLTERHIVAFDGVLPSLLDEEHQYLKQASVDFPEEITSDIQMRCMRDYQRAISDASRRLPCGICGGLFQEDEITILDRNITFESISKASCEPQAGTHVACYTKLTSSVALF